MSEHEFKQQSQMVLSYQWASFFSEVAEDYRGKEILLIPDGQLGVPSENGKQAKLSELQFAHKHGKDTLTIETAVADQTNKLTMRVNLVWVLHNENNELISFEIIDENDKKLVIELSV